MRFIDADKLMEKLSRMIDFCQKDKTVNALSTLFQVGDAIMDCPTVDAVPVVHGHWNWCENGEIRCSKCLGLTGVAYTKNNFKECIEQLNYCSNCGAKMDEVEG